MGTHLKFLPLGTMGTRLNFLPLGTMGTLLNTVGINPTLSDLQGPGPSKLDWRYLEHNKIDRNELQICTTSQRGTGTKMAEKLNNFEKF
jgi:hypothetical protein